MKENLKLWGINTIENFKSYGYVFAVMVMLSLLPHRSVVGSILSATSMWMIVAATLRLLHNEEIRKVRSEEINKNIDMRYQLMSQLVVKSDENQVNS